MTVLRERVRRVVRRRRFRPSVVVVVGPGRESALAETLDSVPGEAEVIVAAWGDAQSPAGVSAATANAARNAATAIATGETITFLDAGELLHEGALERLAAGLGDADVVTGSGPVTSLAHVLWRRTAAPSFRPAHGRLPQAALPVAPATLDVEVAQPVATYPVPFGTVPSTAPDLMALTAVLGAAPHVAAELLSALGPVFLDDLEHVGEAEVDAFAQVLTDELVRRVPDVETRLRLWLVAHGHATAMSRLTAERWFHRGQFPTEVVDGRVLARIPVPGVDLPEWVREVNQELTVSLRRAVATDGLLRLTVFAVLPYVDYEAHPPTVEAHLVHEQGESLALPVTPTPDPAATRHAGQLFQDHAAGAVAIDLDPARASRDGWWHLEVTVDVAGLQRTARVADRDERGSAGVLPQPATVQARLGYDRTHGVHLLVGEAAPLRREEPGVPRAEEVEIGESLLVRGTAPEPFEADLVVAGRAVPGQVTTQGGHFTATFPLVDDPWGLAESALPSGTAHIATRAGRRAADLAIAATLAASTPYTVSAAQHRVEVLRGRRGQLLLRLAAPLADDELGPRAQQRLREAYELEDRPLDPELAVFQSYAGAGSTDSPRAIAEELLRRRPQTRILWTVADHAVAPPPGTEPLLQRSRGWYEALAGAGLVVTNVEMNRFFRTRDGQTLLQTFHGYPSKAMGLGLWRAKNFGPARLERQLLHTSRQWSVILTPSPEMNRHYREQYDYAGPILDRGYPRDDALVGTQATSLRAEARARLGLADDQVAILYAPTWRDELATNFRAAPMATHLDVRALAAALGPRHVVLLRGHRFHAAPGEADRIRDVTDYPEINDLILAADAAVLDYSSLRFDFALTGRPMVFLVPDLERYGGANRGFLFPFEESAPGPLVSTTDEVGRLLRDLPALSTRYAAELVRFNAAYNAHQDGQAAARVVDALLGSVPL